MLFLLYIGAFGSPNLYTGEPLGTRLYIILFSRRWNLLILYVKATTNIPDLVIDFIEVKLSSGKEVSLNWDCSGYSLDGTDYEGRYKGVYFDEEYANGRLDELIDLEITDVGIYSESNSDAEELCISELLFDDNGKELSIKGNLWSIEKNEGDDIGKEQILGH